MDDAAVMYLLWSRGTFFLAHCPEAPGNRGTLVSHTSTFPKTLDWIQLRGILRVSNNFFLVHAFVYSGADGNFIDENLYELMASS